MYVHQGPKRYSISSSHRVPLRPNQSLRVPPPVTSPRIKTQNPKRRRKELENLKLMFEKAWIAASSRALSKIGVLRAAAHDVVSRSRYSGSIERFPRVLHAYASAFMGYENRFVSEEFVLIRMKQLYADRLKARHDDARLQLKVQLQEMDRRRIAVLVREMCFQADAVLASSLASDAVMRIEEELMSLAEKGRRLKHALPRGYVGVQVRVAGIGRTSKMVFILEEEKDAADFTVKALKTIYEFDRIRRSHFRKERGSRSRYMQRPSKLRH